MAKTKVQKAESLSLMSGIAKDAQSAVFVKFDGLPVRAETALRSVLRGNDVSYKVVKKTILGKAFSESSIEGEMPELEGMIALAWGNDLIAPAREVYGFLQDHKDNMEIVGGVFEGRFMDQESMMSIATIPTTPVLYAQLLTMFNSGIQGFTTALDQIAEKKEA
jgi:large subunit ribosomal protein L10